MSQSPATSPQRAATPGRTPFRYTAQLADQIETRWQRHWDEHGTFVAPNPGDPGFDPSKPKFYCLDMFPYPSGAGLHVGHPEGYTATDIISRFKRMKGFNVLHPMGWDAFGLPAEQYAIQTGVHPAETTRKAIDTFRRQLKRFGFCYDWSREFATIDEDYYKWTQWIFLKIYDSWYDRDADKARPISELIEEYETGTREPRVNIMAAEYTGTGDLPDGTRLGAWGTLDPDTKRLVIDSYRLAYLGRQTVNWCPKLGTALANEEVINGKSERGGFPVFRKPLQQWMFRITAYAERLLNDLTTLRWPQSTKLQQAEWIGRSEGAEIDFPLLDPDGSPIGQSVRVFTTRPDTVFGTTYMVVAPEHPLVDMLIESPFPDTPLESLGEYAQRARNRSDLERQETTEKTGVFTGALALNPATNEKIPIWVADYVLMTYGHGAIMAVPAHDDRDHAFARKFALPITQVVQPPENDHVDFSIAAYTGDGVNINSDNDRVSLNGLPTADAKKSIIAWLEKSSRGMAKTNFRLRDWLFSRQRYWGEPFPIVFDQMGNHHPIDAKHLPVTLPDMADYQPIESDDPMPLLAKATDWLNTTAGEAGVPPDVLPPDTPVTREANTMPGWAGSCWYELRYCDPRNDKRFVGREAETYWMGGQRAGSSSSPAIPDSRKLTGAGDGPARSGVDLYIGGAEHAVLHLLYARFWHKVLYDLGEVSTPEPFGRLFHQGLILSFAYQREDKTLVPNDEIEEVAEGTFIERATGQPLTQIVAKMSKSLKNVHNPDDVIAEYGADTFRLYEMYMGPLDASKPWNPRDISGLFRFLQRVWRLAVDEETGELRLASDPDEAIEKQLHRTIAKVEGDIERLAFNTAIASMIEFANAAIAGAPDGGGKLTRDQLERFALALGPFVPHMAEELWHRLGHESSLADAPWPRVDPAMLLDEAIEMPVQIMGKVRGKVTVPADADAKLVESIVLTDEKISVLLQGKAVKKVIVVPGKIVNIIVD